MNLPLIFLILGAGGLFIRAGITGAPQGALGELGKILRGEQGSTIAPRTPRITAGTASYTTTAAGNAAVVGAARSQMGVRYLWGGSTPDGFDCSGLTQWCWGQVGISLPRLASAQQVTGDAVAGLAQAAPGDLLFYGTPAHHCAIYLGAGQQIAAPHTGTVVQLQPVGADLTNIRRPGGAALPPGTVSL